MQFCNYQLPTSPQTPAPGAPLSGDGDPRRGDGPGARTPHMKPRADCGCGSRRSRWCSRGSRLDMGALPTKFLSTQLSSGDSTSGQPPSQRDVRRALGWLWRSASRRLVRVRFDPGRENGPTSSISSRSSCAPCKRAAGGGSQDRLRFCNTSTLWLARARIRQVVGPTRSSATESVTVPSLGHARDGSVLSCVHDRMRGWYIAPALEAPRALALRQI